MPEPLRTFYSSTSANDFFERFQTVLDVHHQRMLQEQEAMLRQSAQAQEAALRQSAQAQEVTFQQVNASIVAMSASIQMLVEALCPQRPLSNRGTTPPPQPSCLPSQQEDLLEEQPPVLPYRSERPPQQPNGGVARELPIREMTAFTSATGEPINNADNVGRVPSLKLSKFCGKDGENVLAWLHQAD